MDSTALGLGKAPPELLAVLSAAKGGSLLQGPGPGHDAAIVEWGDELLVAAADPITFVDADAARLAVTVNANDVFAVGAEPEWLLATILAPEGVARDSLASLLRELQTACDQAGVALIGGHTEVSDAVKRTIISCAIIGRGQRESIVPSDGARDGDIIVQAGAAAVEGTAILGHPQLLDAPGVSIATAARTLRAVEGVHAMHDVTEGGIATAALELAEAAELAPQLRFEDIIWLAETLEVCEAGGLNPLGLLGSGTLLAAVAPDAVEQALFELSRVDVPAAAIGRVRSGAGATLSHGGQIGPLPRFVRDEALRANEAARRAAQ